MDSDRYLVTGVQLGMVKCLDITDWKEIEMIERLLGQILKNQYLGRSEDNVVNDVDKITTLKQRREK